MKNKKVNIDVQDMHVKAHTEVLRAIKRAKRASKINKAALLRDYAELWLRVCNTLELLDSEDFNAVR